MVIAAEYCCAAYPYGRRASLRRPVGRERVLTLFGVGAAGQPASLRGDAPQKLVRPLSDEDALVS
jgi:hypothetical protein